MCYSEHFHRGCTVHQSGPIKTNNKNHPHLHMLIRKHSSKGHLEVSFTNYVQDLYLCDTQMYKESAVITAFVPCHMTLISHNMVREVADHMGKAQRV